MAWPVAGVGVADSWTVTSCVVAGAEFGLEQAPIARLTRITKGRAAKSLWFKVDILSSGRHWAKSTGV